jgi:hypothetical protein
MSTAVTDIETDSHAAARSAADVVADNLAAYNARDLEAFMACFAEGIEVWDQQSGTLVMRGREQVRGTYASVFANSPLLHSQVLHRSCVGSVVVDHEIVTGRHGGDAEVLLTYQVLDGQITRMWWSRVPLNPAAPVR